MLELLARRDYVRRSRHIGCLMLVQCGPGAKIVPAEGCRDAVDAGLAFAFLGARLEQRVIDADVFALGIKRGKGLVERVGAAAGGDLLEDESRIG